MSPCVYKVGGPALEDPRLVGPLAREIQGKQAVLVHGGGPQVEKMLRRMKLESRFVSGRRETSPESMEVVEMVLSGLANKALASGLTRAGVPSIGISGRDAGLIQARRRPELGRVGTPERVDAGPLRALWAHGFVPVVSPVSDDSRGEPLNVNADEAALAIAGALGAGSLVYLSDVDGVIVQGAIVETLSRERALAWIEDGTIAGGMALKVRVALEAASGGVPEVVIAGRGRLEGGCPGTRLEASEHFS